MERLYKRYRDRAAFLFVYIQEAHPADGWQTDSNIREGVTFAAPGTWQARQDVARKCANDLKLSMPCVVDTIANAVDDTYAGWPERIYVIDGDGRVAYAGQIGPWGFKPAKAEWTLANLLRR